MATQKGIFFSSINLAIAITLLLLTLLLVLANEVESQIELRFFILGSYKCPHCNSLKEYLIREFGSHYVIFCSVDSNSTCYDMLIRLAKLCDFPPAVPLTVLFVNTTNITHIALYEGTRFVGYVEYADVEKIVDKYVKGNPIAIVLGEVKDRDFWYALALGKSIKNLSIIGGGTTSIEEIKRESLIDALWRTVVLAAIDSVNPCTIFIYVLLITAAIISGRSSCRVGIPFILAIAVFYAILGLGLTYILAFAPVARIMLIALALALVIINIVKPIGIGKSVLFDYISRASQSPFISFSLGALATVTLLPCSAGPYLVFLAYASTLGYALRIPFMFLYIFVEIYQW